jgi:hypothetical protein
MLWSTCTFAAADINAPPPDAFMTPSPLISKEAQQLTTDYQLARIKTLQKHKRAANHYKALAEALETKVWAANLDPQAVPGPATSCLSMEYEADAATATTAAVCAMYTTCLTTEYESTHPTTTSDRTCTRIPVVPTPCSALTPECFFGTAREAHQIGFNGGAPAPTPTYSQRQMEALGLGVKESALVAECKENGQWLKAISALDEMILGGRKPSPNDTKFIIEGCRDVSGKSWLAQGPMHAKLSKEIQVENTEELSREYRKVLQGKDPVALKIHHKTDTRAP